MKFKFKHGDKVKVNHPFWEKSKGEVLVYRENCDGEIVYLVQFFSNLRMIEEYFEERYLKK